MSHTHTALTNTNSKSLKVHYQEYLEHHDEPKNEWPYEGALAELTADLISNSFYQKRKLRRVAKRLRHLSYG